MRLFVPGRNNATMRIVGIYVVLGALWILFSDAIVESLVGGTMLGHAAHSFKGLAYVAITGLLLWWLIHSHRAQLGRQAYQAQRMDLIGRMAAGVAHDFNNVLSAASGLCALIGEDARNGQVAPADVDELNDILQHGSEMAARLLTIGRSDTLQVTRVDLNQVLRDGARLWQRSAGPRAELSVEPAEALPEVQMDRVQFEQVLLNLVLNARDAMPQGGQLRIATAVVSPGADRPPELALGSGCYVRLTVSDSGVGMDQAALARLFEPFCTSKANGTGFGIGLASVEAIVQSAGGRIAVASQPGQGTTFEVYLPAAAD